MTNQNLYQIGLTMINGVGDILARHLLEYFGDAETIFKEKKRALERVPGIGQMLAAEIKRPEVLQKAEKELVFIEKNKIVCYFLTDPNYPKRLQECPDAPVLFYFKGNTDLNAKQIVSIVGTRKATDYGRTLIASFTQDMAKLFPDILILSGLAYGIDIQAHRCALKEGLSTVGVLAHGLDRLYPPSHRNTAIEMLENGGLLTDFPSNTNPDKPNFLKRNRIIAGLADATIVVESDQRGGSLVTADIASSYSREVFSFPGKVNDQYSQGCNDLIRKNKAGLITSDEDFVNAICWDMNTKGKEMPQQTKIIFPENSLHQQIVTLLREQKEMHINQLSVALQIPIFKLSSLLFELEMEQIVKTGPGNMYKLG
jgi:DNA processing protein